MNERTENTIGTLALISSLGGVAAGLAVGLLARMIGRRVDEPAYAVFLALQAAAIVLGLIAWRTPRGKDATITAAVLAVGSWVLLS